MKTIKFLACSLAIAGVALTSCSKDDNGPSLPPIGGYNSADEVGAADLVAYWPLNGDGKESKSGTAPSNSSNVTFVDGVKGKAANFAVGYMKYPSIAALSSSMSNFTMSTWAKVTNNGVSGSVFLSLARPNEWAGNINFLSETGWSPATSDSLTVKGQLVSSSALGWQDSRNAVKMDQGMIDANTAGQTPAHVAYPNKLGGQWMHCVLTWDNATRMLLVYVNGVKISNPAWELRGAAGQTLDFTTPTYPVIGSFATFANGAAADVWDSGLTGQLDEMRVWKKTLNAADVNSLYELELAGR